MLSDLRASSCSLVALACRLGLLLFGLLLTVLALDNLFGWDGFILLELLGAALGAFDIRVRRGNTLVGHLGRRLNLLTRGVDDARPRLVSCLEFDLPFEGLHLLGVQQIAILIPVLDLLFAADYLLALGLERGRPGDSRGALSPVWGVLLLCWWLLLLLDRWRGCLTLYNGLRRLSGVDTSLGKLVVGIILFKEGVISLHVPNIVADSKQEILRQKLFPPSGAHSSRVHPLTSSPHGNAMGRNTHAIKESIAVPIPCAKQLHTVAFVLGPGISVCKRRQQGEYDRAEGQHSNSASLVDNGVLTNTGNGETGSGEVIDLAESHDSKVQRGEVMVQEKLSLHQVEGEIMEGPAQYCSANLVVKSLEDRVGVVAAATLPSEHGNSLEEHVDHDGKGTGIPDHGVTNKVDLTVVLAPEVDTTAKDGPRGGTGIPSMRFDQASIRFPHDALELPELAEETGLFVVDLFRIGTELRMLVVLDIPNAVGQSTTLGACDFLLLRSPIRKLDLVRKEHAAGHDMDKSELGLDCSKPLLGKSTRRLLLDNFDAEQIIGIASKAFIAVGGNLILPLSLRNRWSDIVRVEASVGLQMVHSDHVTVLDVRHLWKVIPSSCAVDCLALAVQRLGLVLHEPNIVLILVGIQSDLLLLTASGVHEGMRMQISALSVDMADGQPTTESDVNRHILHALVVQSCLKFGAHETISLTGVRQAHEVDGKHGHVESDRDDDKTESTGHEVLGKDSHRHGLRVAQEDPELDQGQRPNPSNREKTNPLDADSDPQTQSSHDKPKPPGCAEGLGRALLMLVCERCEGQGRKSGGNDQGRIEKDQSGLGKETVLKDDQRGTQGSSGCTTANGLEGQEHGGNQQDTADSREHSHGHVRDAGLEVILANVLEIEVSVETGEPTEEGDQHLCQWGVYVHEEAALDVLGSETTETVGCRRVVSLP